MIRDYFADLELNADADLEDVRRAYRRLARRFHPDLNPLDAQAAESFRRIQEAHDALSSTTKILRLSKKIREVSKVNKPEKSSRWENYSLVPKSAEQFVDQWKEEPSITRFPKRPQEELNFKISLELKDQDLRSLSPKQITLKYETPCQTCRGSGGRSRSVKATCKKCAGLGHLLITRGAMNWKKACEDCRGKGYLVSAPCAVCTGRGKVLADQVVELNMGKNPDLSKLISLKGLGNISYDGKRRGDVWVKLVVKQR